MKDESLNETSNRLPSPFRRRAFLTGAGALAAAGWTAGGPGSWFLQAAWGQSKNPIKMGIATDITGAIAPSGNSDWQAAQLAEIVAVSREKVWNAKTRRGRTS